MCKKSSTSSTNLCGLVPQFLVRARSLKNKIEQKAFSVPESRMVPVGKQENCSSRTAIYGVEEGPLPTPFTVALPDSLY